MIMKRLRRGAIARFGRAFPYFGIWHMRHGSSEHAGPARGGPCPEDTICDLGIWLLYSCTSFSVQATADL